MKRSTLGTCLIVLAWLVPSCNGQKPDPNLAEKKDPCAITLEEIDTLKVDVDAKLDTAMVEFAGSTKIDKLKNVKNNFDSIQNDYQLMNQRLCQDVEAGRITKEAVRTLLARHPHDHDRLGNSLGHLDKGLVQLLRHLERLRRLGGRRGRLSQRAAQQAGAQNRHCYFLHVSSVNCLRNLRWTSM